MPGMLPPSTMDLNLFSNDPRDQYTVNGYLRNKWLDLALNHAKAMNDTTPPASSNWMPQALGTLDKGLEAARPGYDRLQQPSTAPMPNLDYMPGMGMLRVGGSPSADMKAGGMNPLMQEILRAERLKRGGYPMPPAQNPIYATPPPADPAAVDPVEVWLRGLIPGVNGQPVPNPNPPRHPTGSTVRG